jgi:hypothetical protein
MQDEASYQFDSCGEEIIVPIDLAAGSRQEYVEDCPVCCCPNVIHVEIDDDSMEMMNFSEWLAQRDEGLLLPDRPPLKGMFKINTTPGTDAQRKRLHPKKVKPPKLFPPTVQKVKEIVPNKLIP